MALEFPGQTRRSLDAAALRHFVRYSPFIGGWGVEPGRIGLSWLRARAIPWGPALSRFL